MKRTVRCLIPLTSGRPGDVERDRIADDLDVGQPLEQLAEHDRELAPRQVGAETEVRSGTAESDVGIRAAEHVETLGVGRTLAGHGCAAP